MILEIHKNNDRLELLHSVSRNQKYNILSCEILKDDNVSNIISEHTSNNNYTSIINSINNSDGEIKILTGGSLSSKMKVKNEKRQIINFESLAELDKFLAIENS